MNLVGEAGGGVGGEGADGEGSGKGGGIGCGDVGGGDGGGASGEGFRGGGGGNDGGGEAGGGDGDNGGDGGHMPEAQIAPLSEANVSTYWTNAGLSVQAQLISSLLASDNESAYCRGGEEESTCEAGRCALVCWGGCGRRMWARTQWRLRAQGAGLRLEAVGRPGMWSRGEE